jgi:hypothetical protein
MLLIKQIQTASRDKRAQPVRNKQKVLWQENHL